MQALLRKIRQILKDRRTRKFFTRVVSSVAAIVVFVTTYALILPAITLEKTAVCGIEAHQHDDSCYEERLVCGQEESDGHHHDDSCYSTKLEQTCGIQEHQHSEENGCYDTDGNLVCQLQEHAHDDSCYEEVRILTCGMEEYAGHHHTDACYEKVLVCGKEVHTHSDKCYEKDSSTDSAEDGDSAGIPSDSADAGDNENAGETGDTGNSVPGTSDSDDSVSEEQSDSYVPELEPLDMESVLNSHTDFYYFHAEEGEEVPANSAEITDWKKADEETTLASTDLVKLYLAYTIPAGSLNATNPTARYRLPDNIHLSDEQIKAINLYENGIAAGYRETGAAATEKVEKDQAEKNYKKYLGVEAVEGDRRPDEQLLDGAQEFISAVVRAENVYDEEGLFGEKGAYLGQDLIFTFAPYSVEKNQNTYDADKILISAGEKITGWFACDFRLDQIDWEQSGDNSDDTAEENFGEEDINREDNVELSDDKNNVENTDSKGNAEKTARIIFVLEDQEKEIEEISRVLSMIEEIGEGSDLRSRNSDF